MAEQSGLVLEDWQQFALDVALRERVDQKWAAFLVKLLVSRRNGKGSILEARTLAGLWLFGERRIVHTAHEFKTAADAFARILRLVEGNRFLERRIRKIVRAHGEEGLLFRNGAELRFLARTGGSGRGLDGDCVFLDEDMYLKPSMMAALMPLMTARPNGQLWFTGSGVQPALGHDGRYVGALRRMAERRSNPRLAFLEWSVDRARFDADPAGTAADPASHREANPAITGGDRFDLESLEQNLGLMGPHLFAIEHLGLGDYPTEDENIERVIEVDAWKQLADPDTRPSRPMAFAIEVSHGRTEPWTSITVTGQRPDGRTQTQLANYQRGTHWAPARMAELVKRWRPVATVLDPASRAGALLPDLRRLGVDPRLTSARDVAQACGALAEAVNAGAARHGDQTALNLAVATAAVKALGDAWLFDRAKSGADVGPLMGAALSRWALLATKPKPQASAPRPVTSSSTARTTPSAAADLRHVGF